MCDPPEWAQVWLTNPKGYGLVVAAGGLVGCGAGGFVGAAVMGRRVGRLVSVTGTAVGSAVGSCVGSSVGSGIGVLVTSGRGVKVARATRVARRVAVDSVRETIGSLKPMLHARTNASAAIEKSSIETMRFRLNCFKLPPMRDVLDKDG